MKIAVSVPGFIGGIAWDTPTRGEGRWSLNWAWVLHHAGHEVYLIGDYDVSDLEFDLFMQAPWWGEQLCGGTVKAKEHVHLRFGAAPPDFEVEGAPCLENGTCNLSFAYQSDFQGTIKKFPDRFFPFFLPTPLDYRMGLGGQLPGFERNRIVWSSKECWHPGILERNPRVLEHVLDWLRALKRLSDKYEFVLDVFQPGEGSMLHEAPPEIQEAFAQLPIQPYGTLMYPEALAVFNNAKMNLSVRGAVSSHMEAFAAGGVCASHLGAPFTDNLDEDLRLPVWPKTSEDQIYDYLERLWSDQQTYDRLHAAGLEQVQPHLNALGYFNRMVNTFGLDLDTRKQIRAGEFYLNKNTVLT